MYSNICHWFNEWYKESDRNFPLDNWELDYVRDDIWQEWETLNEHIERNPEQIKKEHEILDCLLLSSMKWAQKKAPHFVPKEATDFIESIKNKPQTEQHTLEWHAEKINLLTASEFGYVIGTAPAARKNVYDRKFIKAASLANQQAVGLIPVQDSTPVGISNENNLLQPTTWGHRFEPVARNLASMIFFNNNPIADNLGRIIHKTHKKLAASPDGMIESGSQAGHLVEIKCPITRLLVEDEIPYEYYCQMQIQMEVTNCPAVEYIEMKFSQSPILLEKEGWMGVLVVIEENDTLRYEYGPFYKNEAQKLSTWRPTTLKPESIIRERAYWFLEDSHWKTVHRNSFWWTEVGFPGYQQFWSCWDTEYERWLSSQNRYMFVKDD
jgi:putative phage-type endonuclease